MKKKRNVPLIIFCAIALLIPFIFAITRLYLGSIPFWYDPARDLLMALANHDKLSLIGQTSGIPSIFYGPYWIWLLSVALFISLDPRVVAFFVLTLPYFIIVPLVLYQFKKQLGLLTVIILWLLLTLSFPAYQTQIWNPHHAPLLCLLTIFLLVSQDFKSSSWRSYTNILFAGLTAGLLMNTHISFGISVIAGSFLYLLFFGNKLKSLPLFIGGVLITFLPFFVFEMRHGFNQIKTVLETMTSTTAVVKETSVDKMQILAFFFNKFSQVLQISTILGYWLMGLITAVMIILVWKRHVTLEKHEKKLLLIIASIGATTIGIYLLTKNPVWDYHFIGVEILYLLALGVIAKKITTLRYLLLCWAIVLLVLSCFNFAKEFTKNPYKEPTLTAKEHIVTTIYENAGERKFSVKIYSPATYTPDFDYLLQWKGNIIDQETGLIYLIIPWTTKDLRDDFIDNRTPNENYRTVKSWKMPDETEILRRERYEKK